MLISFENEYIDQKRKAECSLCSFAILWYPISGCKFVEQHPNKEKDEEKNGRVIHDKQGDINRDYYWLPGRRRKNGREKNYSERGF